MSRWVLDTSPLIFLAKLDRIDLLRAAADELRMPPVVLEEVFQSRKGIGMGSRVSHLLQHRASA